MHVISTNKELKFKYEIIETYTCGMELKGTEVKSIRAGNVNLKDAFAQVINGEVILKNAYIAPFEKGNINNSTLRRDIRLLLHKSEIVNIVGKIGEKGLTLAPLKIGFEKDLVKLELVLCKGKKLYDKRETIKERDAKRKIANAMKG